MWDWLNQNQGAVVAIAAVVQAIITVILVVLTVVNVKAAGDAAKAASRSAEAAERLVQLEFLPVVHSSANGGIKGKQIHVNLDYRNVGREVAFNVEAWLIFEDGREGERRLIGDTLDAKSGSSKLIEVAEAEYDAVIGRRVSVGTEYRDTVGRRYRTRRTNEGEVSIGEVSNDGTERPLF